jgi:hypothetical protein
MLANLGFVRRSFVAAAFQVIRGLRFMFEEKKKLTEIARQRA